MNSRILDQCINGAFTGTMTFGETVGHMYKTGVEWYSANLVLGAITHYAPCGEHHQTMWENWTRPAIASHFDGGAVVAAIRSSQKGEIIYPEFLQRIAAAGVTYYTVHMQGRKAVYFGRHGESYTEPFPPANG